MWDAPSTDSSQLEQKPEALLRGIEDTTNLYPAAVSIAGASGVLVSSKHALFSAHQVSELTGLSENIDVRVRFSGQPETVFPHTFVVSGAIELNNPPGMPNGNPLGDLAVVTLDSPFRRSWVIRLRVSRATLRVQLNSRV